MPLHFKEQVLNLPTMRRPQASGPQPAIVARMNANENPLGPSARAVAAMQEAAPLVNRYPDPGAWALKRALAARFNVGPETIMCTNGSDEEILLLCLGFLREGDEVVMAQGSFISYYMRTLGMGGQPIRVPLRDHVHDLPALADAITGQARLVFLCNPNNPTGTTVGADEVRRFLARVPEDVLIVADEAYIEFAEQRDLPDLIAEVRAGRPNLVVLRTFAKIYGLAGIRLGYSFAHPDLIAYLERTRPIFNVNALAQAAGLAALDDQEHVTRSREHASASRAFFTRELAALGLKTVPSATNFIAVEVGDDAAVAAKLMEHGIAVNPISGWGVPGHIRISFGTDEENARCLAALRAIVQPAVATA